MLIFYYDYQFQDYDEGLLDKKHVLRYEEKKLQVKNYFLKANSEPVKYISVESFIHNRYET
jgi:hypothetical protein